MICSRSSPLLLHSGYAGLNVLEGTEQNQDETRTKTLLHMKQLCNKGEKERDRENYALIHSTCSKKGEKKVYSNGHPKLK